MKKYRIEIKSTAENNLTERYQQIAEESPQNAVTWYLQTIEAIEKLDVLAERCPIAPEDLEIQQGLRHLIIGHIVSCTLSMASWLKCYMFAMGEWTESYKRI